MDRPTLLCVHPHPDDEAIACGGVLARAADQDVRTVVVTCTGGEEGENLAGIDLGTRPLADHRRDELAAALAILGVEQHHWLGYRDSGMVGTAPNDHPEAFCQTDVETAAHRLAAIIRRERPQVVVSDDEQGTYGHPDHIMANRVTARAVVLAADADASLDGEPWQVAKRYVHVLTHGRIATIERALADAGLVSPFGESSDGPAVELATEASRDANAGPATVTTGDPASGGQLTGGADEPPASDGAIFGVDDGQVTTQVDVGAWMSTKRQAMAAHRSQIGPDSFFLNLPDALAAQAFAVEQFALRDGQMGVTDGLERDLFDGLPPSVAAPSVAAPSGAAPSVREVGAVTDSEFRDVMGRFVTGVAVMTTRTDGLPHAMTANAVTSLSLNPKLVLVCVDRGAAMLDQVASAGVFGLSFLPAGAIEQSVWFADPERPGGDGQFSRVDTFDGATGVPLLVDHAGWVECQVWAQHDGGDHVIVVGEVIAIGVEGARVPLAYHRGAYGRFVADEPAH